MITPRSFFFWPPPTSADTARAAGRRLFATVLVALAVGCVVPGPQAWAAPRPVTRGAAFTLPDSAGRAVSLSNYLHRNRVVVVFNPPAPYLARVRDHAPQYQDRDLVVLAVVRPGSPLARQPSRPPLWVLHDPEGRVARAWTVPPRSTQFVLIGKDGHTAMTRRGVPTDRELFGTIDRMPMRRDEMRRRGR